MKKGLSNNFPNFYNDCATSLDFRGTISKLVGRLCKIPSLIHPLLGDWKSLSKVPSPFERWAKSIPKILITEGPIFAKFTPNFAFAGLRGFGHGRRPEIWIDCFGACDYSPKTNDSADVFRRRRGRGKTLYLTTRFVFTPSHLPINPLWKSRGYLKHTHPLDNKPLSNVLSAFVSFVLFTSVGAAFSTTPRSTLRKFPKIRPWSLGAKEPNLRGRKKKR